MDKKIKCILFCFLLLITCSCESNKGTIDFKTGSFVYSGSEIVIYEAKRIESIIVKFEKSENNECKNENVFKNRKSGNYYNVKVGFMEPGNDEYIYCGFVDIGTSSNQYDTYHMNLDLSLLYKLDYYAHVELMLNGCTDLTVIDSTELQQICLIFHNAKGNISCPPEYNRILLYMVF